MALEEDIRNEPVSRSAPETAEGWKGNVVTRDGKRVLRLFSRSGETIDLSADMDARMWKSRSGTEATTAVVESIPENVMRLANALAHLNELPETSEINAMVSRLRLMLRTDPAAQEIRESLGA